MLAAVGRQKPLRSGDLLDPPPTDVPLLFSGGLYRVRVERPDLLDPHLLLALLWSEIVRRQLRSKRLTRDVSR